MGGKLRVLMVEDAPDDAELVRRELRRSDHDVVSEVVQTRAAYEEALARGGWDIILCDHNLPGFDSIEALQLLRDRHQDIPFIIVSGAIGEEVAVAAMKAGASDYVLKGNLTRLAPAVERELRDAAVRREKGKTDAESRRLTAIVEATPDLVAMTDAAGRLVYLNAAGRKLLSGGEEPAAVPGVNGWPAGEKALALAAERGEWSEETTLLTSDGHHVPVSQVTLAHRGQSGNIEFFSLIARDMSERKATETALLENNRLLEDALARLQEADRRKDEFLATLSHELRNPLASLRNAVDIMRLMEQLPDELQWVRTVLDHQIARLTRLVNDLLDVSRFMQGAITLQKEPIDLASVFDRAVEMARSVVQSRKQSLHVALPEETVLLDGDLVRLSQVVSNLLNNAAKYMHQGGNIWLTGAVTDETIVIRVRDTGIGMAPDLLPRVFDAFTQGPRPSDGAPEGLGIGLNLVKTLVTLHGGRVEAESPGVGKGSTFTVTLPRRHAQATKAAQDRGDSSTTATPSALRVLIVEDDYYAATSLMVLLRHLGCTVERAEDGPTALAMAPAYQPDIVLLDIGLPGMDGYEVARRLLSRFRKSDLTLVAMTGYGLEADKQRAAQAGFDHHLTKPVDLATVRDILGTIAPGKG